MPFAGAIQSLVDTFGAKPKGPEPVDVASEEAAHKAERVRKAHWHLLEGAKSLTARENILAMDSFQSAFIAFRDAEDLDNASLAQKVVSLLFIYMKDPNDVRQACINARSLLENSGMRDEAARVLMHLGDFEVGIKDFKRADSAYKVALNLSRAAGDHDAEVDCLCRHGMSYARRCDSGEARTLITMARTIAERHERQDLIAFAEAQLDDVSSVTAQALLEEQSSLSLG